MHYPWSQGSISAVYSAILVFTKTLTYFTERTGRGYKKVEKKSIQENYTKIKQDIQGLFYVELNKIEIKKPKQEEDKKTDESNGGNALSM